MSAAERKRLPDYGDLMTIEAFRESVEGGGFIDYDGFGEWATLTECEDGGPETWVYPSEFKSGKAKPPEWATHVLWFNK